MPEPLRFLCEIHVGERVRRVIRNTARVDLETVPGNINHDDGLIVQYANLNQRIIVTRDSGFPARRLCRMIKGVLFIPQTVNGRTLRLEDILECLKKLLRSDKLLTLGHGVCTVLPDRVIFRLPSGIEEYAIKDI